MRGSKRAQAGENAHGADEHLLGVKLSRGMESTNEIGWGKVAPGIENGVLTEQNGLGNTWTITEQNGLGIEKIITEQNGLGIEKVITEQNALEIEQVITETRNHRIEN